MIDFDALKLKGVRSRFLVLGTLVGLMGLVTSILVVPAQSVYAQSEEEEKPQQATRRIPAMSEQVFNRLAEAQEHIDLQEYAKADEVLEKLLERRRLNGNERGQVHNVLAFVAMEREDNADMIHHLKNVLAEGDQITEGLEVQTLYTLAQLNYVEEDYEEALKYMHLWIEKQRNSSPQPHVFLSQIYYQMENFEDAVKSVETAIEIARNSDLDVKENWWALLRVFYFELENIPKVTEILKILVRDFPKKEYWIQLCGMYAEQDMDQELLYCFETAHVGGFLDSESMMRNYQGLLMNVGVPYRAAKYLQQAMDEGVVDGEDEENLSSLGQAYQYAEEQEEAIEAFEAAAEISEKGTTFERLSQLYFERDEFEKCVASTEKAQQKGGVRDESGLFNVKALCLFNLDRLSQAREAFVEMRRIARREKEEADEKISGQWIVHIDREKERRDTLQARQ